MDESINIKEKYTFNIVGIWTPIEVFRDKRLTSNEKYLLQVIKMLDGKDGCFASNEYMADFMEVTEQTVSNGISNLKKCGYIYQESFDGRKRVIKINSDYKFAYNESISNFGGRLKDDLKYINKSIIKENIIVESKDSTSDNSDMQDILNSWNSVASKTEGLSVHKKLSSKVDISGSGGKYYRIDKIISDSLNIYQKKDIIQAINNYYIILNDSNCWYTHKFKNIGWFLSSDSGMVEFLTKNDPFTKYKKNTYTISSIKFEPLTTIYSSSNITNFDNQTYYGYDLNEVKNNTMNEEYLQMHIKGVAGKIFDFEAFILLERVIIQMYWKRKDNLENEEFKNKLNNYLELWNSKKEEFREQAKKLINEC
jgi:biotin operon repressor